MSDPLRWRLPALVAVVAVIVAGVVFSHHSPSTTSPPYTFAVPGENVVTVDGKTICTVSAPLSNHGVVSASGWCADWQILPPHDGDEVDESGGWVRRGPRGGMQLHFADGWRP